MIKKGNEEWRATLEYLPRGPRVPSYATGEMFHMVFAFVADSCEEMANYCAHKVYIQNSAIVSVTVSRKL